MSSTTTGPAGGRRFWIVVFCFALANTAVWIGYHRWVVAHRHSFLEVTQFTPGNGARSGWAPGVSLVVQPGCGSGLRQDPPPGKITPAVPGKWQWGTPRTLTFTPDINLPKATAITISLGAEGLHTADGFRLGKVVSNTIHTEPLRVLATRQTSFDDDRVAVELKFNDKVLPADLYKNLIVLGPGGKVIAFHPHGDLVGNSVRVITDPLTDAYSPAI